MADDEIFSKQKAWEIYGKHVLVGLSYEDGQGTVIERKEVHGRAVRVNQREGIVLLLSDGSEFRLPPDLRYIQKAAPGEYKLKSSGEIVANPDYLCTCTITRSPKK